MAAETMNCFGNAVYFCIICAKTKYLFIRNFSGLEENMHINFILDFFEHKLKWNKGNRLVYMHLKRFWIKTIFTDFIMNVVGGPFFLADPLDFRYDF